MRQHVDFPDALPGFVVHFIAADRNDARVGAENIDGAKFVFRKFHQADDILLFAHIADNGFTLNFGGYGFSTRFIDIRRDNRFGAFLRESLTQPPTDAGCCACHNNDLSCYFHSLSS